MKKTAQKVKKQNKVTNKKLAKTPNVRKLIFTVFASIAIIITLILTLYEINQQQELRGRAQLVQGLHVSGNQLLNGQGQQVVLHGVDRSGTEYQCVHGTGLVFDGPSDAASVQQMKAWNINVVRVPLNEDCWLGINGANPSGAAYQQAIVQYVNLLNQNNLYVIVDLHWNNSGTNLATAQEDMADADHALSFWTSVAQTFKGNNNVIFDLYNEPHDVSWSCWLNGGCSAPFPVAGMNQLISAIRSTGATNVVEAGGLGFANDLSQWLANKPTDPLNNLMASWHVYNFNSCSNTSCYDSQVAPVAAQVPITIGELGENDCAESFIDMTMNWADTKNVGYIAWAWNTTNCASFPALISDYNGTPTAFGQGLKNHLAQLPPLPTLATKPTMPQTTTAPSNTVPQPTISPTFGAIGDCQTMGACPSPSQTLSPTQIPAPTQSISPTQVPSGPSGTQASPTPQTTTQPGNPSTPPSQNPGGNNQGLLQLLLQFIQLLLQLLTALFGGKH